jgi:deazaflavin-dependent oxidoreductase (nitroreductase family)
MTENTLRKRVFRVLNFFQILMWRMGMGRWLSMFPSTTGTYLVLTHYGRKSGRKYRTPVNFASFNGDVYITAGFGSISDWYQNIIANPQVEVWLPDGWYVATASDVKVDQETLPILRKILVNSGFAAPMMGIQPNRLSDDELLELCKDYRLVHIQRSAPRTGNDGPGDLVWMWPLFMFLLLTKKRRKRR